MAELDFNLVGTNRVVLSISEADIILDSPPAVSNFTSIDNYANATATSGTIGLTTLPSGLNIFNTRLGATVEYSLSSSGISNTYRSTGFESFLGRSGMTLSGSKSMGRI